MLRQLRSTPPGPLALKRTRRGPLLAVVLAVALAATLAFSADAQANWAVGHDSSSIAEVAPPASDGDAIVGPGDQLSLTEKVISAVTTGTLTNVSATLATTASGITINQAASAYPDLAFGSPQGNTTPFLATLSPSVDCGIVVPFTLNLTASQAGKTDIATIPFSIQTGGRGPYSAYPGTQVPQPIPDVGSAVSRFTVANPGRVRGLRVTVNVAHTYDGDLRIELIAPDGTDVHLIEPNPNNNGKNFTSTTFDDAAATAIGSGTAPYTGSYRPAQPLSTFNGVQQQGTWQLKVTDVSPGDTGTLNSWSASIAAAACTTAPIGSFTATPNPAAPGATVSFDASGSVSPTGATITDYKWDLDGSGAYATDTGATPTTSRVYPARGSVNVGLRVTDVNGKSSQTTLPVAITQAPVAVLSFNPATPVSGQVVSFDASASTHDPAGRIVDYRWDLDGSGSFATDTGSTPSVTTSYPTQRTVPVSVRVTDDVGATASTSQTVTIGNAPPVASFTASAPALVGQPVSFDASSSSDLDGVVTDYRWDLDGSGAYATDTGSTPSVSHTYTSPGYVSVGLLVTDNDGAPSTKKTITIQVTRPPVAALGASPASPVAGSPVTLDASGSGSPDGTIVRYQWDLDGSGRFATSTGSTSLLSTSFSAGSHPVAVRVTDSYGATATKTITLAVSAPAGTGGGTGSVTPGGTTGVTGVTGVTGTPGGLLALVGTTTGGDPTASIAGLTRGDLQAIVVGSDNHFAALTGLPIRAIKAVTRNGLWVNLLSDRPATFNLVISISAGDARRLHFALRRRARGVLGLASVSTRLTAAGQRAFDVKLGPSVRTRLVRLRGRLQLLVTGSAVDAQGHRTALSRVFLVRR